MLSQPLTLPTELRVSVPSENETAKMLRRILDYWGEDGAMWLKGGADLHAKFRGEPVRACALIALHDYVGANCDSPEFKTAYRCLTEAAEEMGFTRGIRGPDAAAVCSDTGFPNARAMVLRAIELSGERITAL